MLSLDFFIANVSAGVLSALCSVCDFTCSLKLGQTTLLQCKKKEPSEMANVAHSHLKADVMIS